jgi:hypothetical protein
MERFLSRMRGRTFPWPYWSPFDELKKKKMFFFCQIAAVNFEACIAFLSRVTGKTFPWPCWSPFDNFLEFFFCQTVAVNFVIWRAFFHT